MDNRIKELIAIGASVAANCQPCVEYHAGKARENGAEQKEIAEAIAIGKIVRKGATGKMDRFLSATLSGMPADTNTDKEPGDDNSECSL